MARGTVPVLVLIAVTLAAAPALADDSTEFALQLLKLWFPLLLMIAVWFYFIRKLGAGKQREAIERSIPHMDALERKLDRIIELPERQKP